MLLRGSKVGIVMAEKREFIEFKPASVNDSVPAFRVLKLPKKCRIDYGEPAILVRAGLDPEVENALIARAAQRYASSHPPLPVPVRGWVS